MTDNEIIKALECCGIDDCRDCPCYTEELGCDHNLQLLALDLINRQKAEIEHLKLTTIVGEVREIPIKFEKLACISWEHPLVEAVKAEAIKEFAGRLKHESYHPFLAFDAIDKCVKEMTEGE